MEKVSIFRHDVVLTLKNLILVAALLLVTSITSGQTLQKGNLVGTHVLSINLDPDVTMNQFKAFFMNKWIPELEKHFTGVKAFLLQGIRGENKNNFGVIYIYESEEARNKFWKDDGSTTELGALAFKKMDPVGTELNKLGTWTWNYTDWIIQ